MSHQALYRKFRPGRFNGVLGQEHITTILKNQVATQNTAHAYLFTGSRGTGKTSTARILARAVNCMEPEQGEPCGRCAACLASAGENADIVELDAASNSSVDDIRALMEKVRYTPLHLTKKVYIIDEVHALAASNQAFNALLKTLEEPPAHAMFILATTEPHKVPATIISRCQRMDFRRLGIQDIVSCLSGALQGSGASIAEEGMLAIARAAEGGMRDALSIADQCISFCGNSVSAEDVYSVLGGMNADFLFQMAGALVDGDATAALELLGQVSASGRDVRVFVGDLAQHMRALLLAKLCGPCRELLDCTEDAMQRYLAQAGRCGELRLLGAVEQLLEAQAKLRWAALPRALVESTLVRIALPEGAAQISELIERIELLEQRIKVGGMQQAAQPQAAAEPQPQGSRPGVQPAPQPEQPKTQPEQPKTQPGQPETQSGQAVPPQEVWKQLRLRVNGLDAAAAVMMMRVQRVSEEGGVLTAVFDSPIYFNALDKPKFKEMLGGELKAIRPDLTLKMQLAGATAAEQKARELFGDSLVVD